MSYVLSIIVLLIDIWAIINVLGSSASGLSKLLWIIGIIVLPVIGAIAWFLVGPKSGRAIA
ncbi:MAG: PLDc N-terminal domain-containing protein [Sphingomonadales bacterium]|nr:PLDc N-terminal domain-containing protein [Sphingomonadales bacterium]MBD3774754.1 PLDc N-terminal domain-containing protein [Paracoccaceae bacterium]